MARRLVWHDEFDGPAGAPASSVWSYDLGDGSAHGNPGWGNGELQHYTDGNENAALDGYGNLVITARRVDGGYTSARLITKGALELQYGRIEARIRVPRGAGLWPAFWALGANMDKIGWPACGEIDVMEHVGREPRRVYGALHGPGYSGGAGIAQTLDLLEDVAADYHVFAVDWEPDSIAWSVEGREYHRVRRDDVEPNPWVFDRPFFLLLNIAVGGTLGGEVSEETVFPQEMRVDYVRVYERMSA